jgi:hypothetical protein
MASTHAKKDIDSLSPVSAGMGNLAPLVQIRILTEETNRDYPLTNEERGLSEFSTRASSVKSTL